MIKFTIPAEEKIYVFINSRQIGALCGYEEQTVQKLCPVEEIGSNAPAGFVTGKMEHRAVIRFVALEAENQLPLLNELTDSGAFTLEIVSGRRKLQFTGCEYSSFETRYEAGGPVYCKAEIRAVSRSYRAEDGKEISDAAAG